MQLKLCHYQDNKVNFLRQGSILEGFLDVSKNPRAAAVKDKIS